MSRSVVAKNKVISITYVLRNQAGDIVEIRDLPVAYLHGSGSDLFPEIERALDGRAIGDRVVIELPPSAAFGAHDPNLTFTDDIENVPPELRRIGMQFEAQNDKGEARAFVVARIDRGKVTVDANHPLAGQTVTFEVTVQDVRDATPAEIKAGRPQSPLDAPLQ